jgi:hypothetical protein
MKQQFVELTPKEIFFGNAPKLQSAAAGSLINSAATQSIIQPTLNPFSTDVFAQQQVGFVLSDFLWKNRWPIGIGIGVLVLGGIYFYNSNKKSEEENRYR